MGKETNSLTLTDVLGPLAQSAERGADNAKAVSSTLTRTSIQIYFSPFFVVLFFVFFLCVCLFSLLLCYFMFIAGRLLF